MQLPTTALISLLTLLATPTLALDCEQVQLQFYSGCSATHPNAAADAATIRNAISGQLNSLIGNCGVSCFSKTETYLCKGSTVNMVYCTMMRAPKNTNWFKKVYHPVPAYTLKTAGQSCDVHCDSLKWGCGGSYGKCSVETA